MKRILTAATKFYKGLTWRGVLNMFLAAVLLFALVKTCLKDMEYEKLLAEARKVPTLPSTPASIQAEEISRKVAKEGREQVIYEIAEPIIRKIVDQAVLDSFAREAEVDKKKIKEVLYINGELVKENTVLRRNITKVGNLPNDTSWHYKDPYFAIDGFFRDTNFVISKLRADASVKKVDYDYKKYWLLGRNETRAKVWFNSPDIRVNGMNTLTLKNPEPFFDLDVNVGAKYLHDQKQLYIGPSVRVGLGRVGVSAGYYLAPVGRVGRSLWYGADWKLY